MTIVAKIDVTKIDKARIFEGKKGKYIKILLFEGKNGPDPFGNDFMVVQAVSKEERAQGIKGPILGNAKYLGGEPSQPAPPPKPSRPRPSPAPPPAGPDVGDGHDDDDVPF